MFMTACFGIAIKVTGTYCVLRSFASVADVNATLPSTAEVYGNAMAFNGHHYRHYLVGRQKASTSIGRREAASDFTNNIYDKTIVVESAVKIAILYTSCNSLARAHFSHSMCSTH